ncbi:T9SS type A sorting domain-containing protein, partial [Candidatus Poribacteria bacterium]|nr:T9SS type A sorting domain-containing protein [Candidatus Poribacteria bacterium]
PSSLYFSDNFEDDDVSDWIGGYYSGTLTRGGQRSGQPIVKAERNAAKTGSYGLMLTKDQQIGNTALVASPEFGPIKTPFKVEFDILLGNHNQIVWLGSEAPFETSSEYKVSHLGVAFDQGKISPRDHSSPLLGHYVPDNFYHVIMVADPSEKLFDITVTGNLTSPEGKLVNELTMKSLPFENDNIDDGIRRICFLTGTRVPPDVSLKVDNLYIGQVDTEDDIPDPPISGSQVVYQDLTGDGAEDIYISNGRIWLMTNGEDIESNSSRIIVFSEGGISGENSLLDSFSQELQSADVYPGPYSGIGQEISRVQMTDSSISDYLGVQFGYTLNPSTADGPKVDDRSIRAQYTVIIPKQAEYALIKTVFTNQSQKTINIENPNGWIHHGLGIAHLTAPGVDKIYLNNSGAITHRKWATYSFSSSRPYVVYTYSDINSSMTNGPVGKSPRQFFAHSNSEDGFSWQMSGLTLSPGESEEYTHMLAFHSGAEEKADQLYTEAVDNLNLLDNAVKFFENGEEPSSERILELASYEAVPGEDISIQISMTDLTGMASADIIMKYDPSIITVNEAKATDLLSGMNLIVNNNTPGELLVFVAGAQEISSGSGNIIDISLTVRENAPEDIETPLTFDNSTQIYDEQGNVVPVNLENGALKIIQPGIKGDVNNDGKVRSNDATLALRIAAGLMTPTSLQSWAADMNDDGKVRSNDATLILRKAAGLTAPELPLIANKGVVPWVSLGEIYGNLGERISVPLMAENIEAIGSGEVQIAYDVSVLRPVGVSTEPGMLMAGNLNEPGCIRMAFASPDKLDNKALAVIEFEVLTDSVSPLVFKNIELFGHDSRSIDSRSIDGSFKTWSTPASSSALMQNFPNPFNPETWIPYQLQSGSQVEIKIHDSSGKLVRELDLGYKPAGYYTNRERAAYWDGRNEVGEKLSSGVYFYTIKTDGFVDTRKFIMMK